MKFFRKRIFLPIWLIRIKNFRTNDVNKLVNFAFTVGGGIIKPSQVKDEILKFLVFLSKLRLRYILEIGTASGGTMFLFSRIASQDATIISIDLPKGPFGGGYPEWKIPLFKSFALPHQRIHLIRSNSHKEETLEKTKSILGDKKLDLLFIDGDHTYEGVKKDFKMYSPLVKIGGIVAFHDIVPGPERKVGGVPKFWAELKEKYKPNIIEIVKDWDQNGYGIGFIKLK